MPTSAGSRMTGGHPRAVISAPAPSSTSRTPVRSVHPHRCRRDWATIRPDALAQHHRRVGEVARIDDSLDIPACAESVDREIAEYGSVGRRRQQLASMCGEGGELRLVARRLRYGKLYGS
jgi:hypothetical protein